METEFRKRGFVRSTTALVDFLEANFLNTVGKVAGFAFVALDLWRPENKVLEPTNVVDQFWQIGDRYGKFPQ